MFELGKTQKSREWRLKGIGKLLKRVVNLRKVLIIPKVQDKSLMNLLLKMDKLKTKMMMKRIK